jgi:KipI family sensor histidine kinase inhibitor
MLGPIWVNRARYGARRGSGFRMAFIAPDRPMIVPLGDSGILVRFGEQLDDAANRAAIGFADSVLQSPPAGVEEVVPSLVSVFLRYDPMQSDFGGICGELRLRLTGRPSAHSPNTHIIEVRFGGADGPDLEAVAAELGLDAPGFIARHNALPLRVLTTGFAPGFVYCGFHPEGLVLPRRQSVRPMVPAGSVLFAAGQTAIATTDIPTGWHVIGRTAFRNFDPLTDPPTHLRAGDLLTFRAI